MSRRTKLTIAALLVLLTIPVVYVIITWSPVNPLRFRVVKNLGVGPSDYPREMVHVVQVEIRNTSAAPILIHSGYLFTGAGSGELDHRQISGPHSAPIPIPAYGVYTCEAFLARDGGYADLFTAPVSMDYVWTSYTRYRCCEVLQWVAGRLPWHINPRLYLPAPQNDRAPVDISSLPVR